MYTDLIFLVGYWKIGVQVVADPPYWLKDNVTKKVVYMGDSARPWYLQLARIFYALSDRPRYPKLQTLPLCPED